MRRRSLVTVLYAVGALTISVHPAASERLIASLSNHRVMVTSNLPFGRWGETFSDDVVAAAMIDRLVHHAEVLTLTGDSYRTRQRRELLAKENRAANN